MASSRQMRRSGLPSPIPPPVDNPRVSRNHDRPQSYLRPDVDEWDEPPLRNPVPSFEDYKGLERHGVLEHMAPLGSLPNSRVKARVRQYDPPRRPLPLRNGEVKVSGEDMSTPEPPPQLLGRQPMPNAEEMAQPVLPVLPEQGKVVQNNMSHEVLDEHIDPSLRPVTNFSSSQASPTRPTSNHSTSCPTSTSQAKWKPIVDSAIKCASEKGRNRMGPAILKLYEESTQNQALADLLEIVLYHTPTDQQKAEFQIYVKAAKKQTKKKDKGIKASASSSVMSKSPAKSLRSSVTRQMENVKDSPEFIFNNISASTSQSPPVKPSLSHRLPNGTPSKDQRPSKRTKRHASASSDSSLSSLNSEVENYAPGKVESTLSRATADSSVLAPTSKAHPGIGPRLGSFSNSRTTPDDSPEARIAARRRLAQGFDAYPVDESHLRSPLLTPKQPSTSPTSLQPRGQQSRRNGNLPKSKLSDGDFPDSPTSSQGEFLLPPPQGPSRGITPQLGRPLKAGKKAARIKRSPLKKRNGVTAGLAQPSEIETNHSAHGHLDDNAAETDVCTACSGSGSLVLCDGCPRGFHFTCCDPPIHPGTQPDDLPEHWYCSRCAQFHTDVEPEKGPRGIWTELKKNMNFRNTSAFHLPPEVRDYFEGVTTGEEGEYEELHNVKITKARTGYEEFPDNLRLKDKKDNTVLCFSCGASSLGKREVIACDYCSLCWHLDCLDPPLASAPNKKSTNGKPRQTWMCPNHVDHELTNLRASTTSAGKKASRFTAARSPGAGERVFRTRKPKQATMVEVGLRRGFRNNGLVDIDLESDDGESEVEREMAGVIYRVPELGIKLDFIDRIRRENLEADALERQSGSSSRRKQTPRTIQTAAPPAKAARGPKDADVRSFKERKAALNLVQMAQQDTELNPDRLGNLIDTLTAEAPAAVESLMAAEKQAAGSNVAPVTEQERKDLEALLALVQRRLGSS